MGGTGGDSAKSLREADAWTVRNITESGAIEGNNIITHVSKRRAEMVIIQLAGGLGNQMFQYALYLQIQNQGREVKIDDVSGFAEDVQRTPALAPFGITYERPTVEELRRMLDSSPRLWNRVRRKFFGRHKKAYFEESKRFLPEVLTWDDIYLEGYWQTEKYFQAVEEQVRSAYDTDKLITYLQQTGSWNGRNICARGQRCKSPQEYLEEIDNTCSISIHVRGGDYLTPENQVLFGNICTDIYYIEGIRKMRAQYPGCRFFLFTNDRIWKMFSEPDITWIDLPETAGKDYAEFVLMSRCKHHILANSSFSWWASYLNKNLEKTVLVPKRWLNDVDCSDFYRGDMQKIDENTK